MPRAQDAQERRVSVLHYLNDERYFAIKYMDVRREASRGPHMCLVRPQLSSGGAGTGIVLPGHGTSTSL